MSLSLHYGRTTFTTGCPYVEGDFSTTLNAVTPGLDYTGTINMIGNLFNVHLFYDVDHWSMTLICTDCGGCELGMEIDTTNTTLYGGYADNHKDFTNCPGPCPDHAYVDTTHIEIGGV